MDDHAVEAPEQAAPETRAPRRAAWQQVVGGEDERLARAQKQQVELGGVEPLEVDDVSRPAEDAS
jgi:hypothetical protein